MKSQMNAYTQTKNAAKNNAANGKKAFIEPKRIFGPGLGTWHTGQISLYVALFFSFSTRFTILKSTQSSPAVIQCAWKSSEMKRAHLASFDGIRNLFPSLEACSTRHNLKYVVGNSMRRVECVIDGDGRGFET